MFVEVLTCLALSRLERDVLQDTNAARVAHGVSVLAAAPDLTAEARRYAHRMSVRGVLAHNPTYAEEAGSDWLAVGENVGYGPNAARVDRAFMRSPRHRANVLDVGYTEVGVGVVRRGDRTWIVVDFRQPVYTSGPV